MPLYCYYIVIFNHNKYYSVLIHPIIKHSTIYPIYEQILSLQIITHCFLYMFIYISQVIMSWQIHPIKHIQLTFRNWFQTENTTVTVIGSKYDIQYKQTFISSITESIILLLVIMSDIDGFEWLILRNSKYYDPISL